MAEYTKAQRAEMKRLTARARRRQDQEQQDFIAGLWRFPVLHKTDFDPCGDGRWLYFDRETKHAEKTTVVLLLGSKSWVFQCVGDETSGLLRYLSVVICEPDPA